MSQVELKIQNKEQQAQNKPLDFNKIKEKLANSKGKTYWRSLEELSDTAEFQEWVEDEFPNRTSLKGIDRRDFLKYMGASMFMASLSGCRSVFTPQEKVVPYVKGPEDMIPGNAMYFATASVRGGLATGLLVTSTMGRPIKIDGNPEHPASQGGIDAITQATILDMYDPDRSQSVLRNGNVSSWNEFLTDLRQELDKLSATKGKGMAILTETLNSPTQIQQLKEIFVKYPEAKWCQYQAVSQDNIKQGSIGAFGEAVNTYYDLKKADVILSIDADFLGSMQPSVRMAKDYASKRKVEGTKTEFNRFYMVESSSTITGANADHRLPLTPAELYEFTRNLAIRLGAINGTESKGNHLIDQKWFNALAKDLQKNAGKSVIIPGEYAETRIHTLTHAINQKLGNVGKTILYTAPIETELPGISMNIKDLMNLMVRGELNSLFILGINPAFTIPQISLQNKTYTFAEALAKVKLSVHLGLYNDETGFCCKWHLPEAHYLESWGDARAYDGTVSIIQPLLAPLYPSCKTLSDFLSILNNKDISGYDLVRNQWQKQSQAANFEDFWAQSLDRGIIRGTTLAPKAVEVKSTSMFLTSRNQNNIKKPTQNQYFLQLRYDPTLYDGRYANNGWLQELPKPLTKLTWDNTAQISPAMAERLKLSNHDRIELDGGEDRKVIAPVWIVPGHPDNTITVHLGYGRTKAGMVGENAGFNAYILQDSDFVSLKKLSGYHALATTQMHQNMEGRDLARVGTIAEFIRNPSLRPADQKDEEDSISFYPKDVQPYDGHKWAMLIDLNLCTGCNACVIACQSENNIPVVGKTQVNRGRHMHWMRIDTYFAAKAEDTKNKKLLENPEIFLQPVACMHCEKAPCEPVCPVAATVHSHEGLNQMVYNRCIGTRYCSNNCPYKVRRFNFLNFADKVDYPSKLLVHNPRVTVRGRGVMEKCTYCVQRINEARIEAKKEGRTVRDGEIITACQQACPTHAIVFGDISDPNSKVSKLKREPRDYKLLNELNTSPRTSYLVKLRNPNQEIEA